LNSRRSISGSLARRACQTKVAISATPSTIGISTLPELKPPLLFDSARP